jgi:hypothetical protein
MRPAKPIGPEQQPPRLHAAQHRTTPRRPRRRADRHPLPRRAPPEKPPRQAPPPTWGRRRQMPSSAAPPRPEAPAPFEDEAHRHRGKGRRQQRQGEGRRRAGGEGGLGFPPCRQRRATRGRGSPNLCFSPAAHTEWTELRTSCTLCPSLQEGETVQKKEGER